MISLFRLPFNSLKRLSRLRSLFFLAFFCLRFHVNHKSLLLFLLSWFYSTGRERVGEREWFHTNWDDEFLLSAYSCRKKTTPRINAVFNTRINAQSLLIGCLSSVFIFLFTFIVSSSCISFPRRTFFTPVRDERADKYIEYMRQYGLYYFQTELRRWGKGDTKRASERACVCTRVTGKWITTGGSWCRLLVLVVVSVF